VVETDGVYERTIKIILKEREHKKHGLGRLASSKTSINEQFKVTFDECAARCTISDVYAQEVDVPSFVNCL
jgi:hypothetical protein